MPTLTLALWLADAEKRLAHVLKDKDIAHQDVHWIASKILKRDRSWLLTHRDATLKTLQLWNLNRLLRRRLRDEPLAYLLNSAPFYGRDFYVDKRVLIPRPETEDLIEIALRRLEHLKHPTIIDVGTGSGAISITMALESHDATVFATDLSRRALAIAKKNAKHLKAKIHFNKGNLLTAKLLNKIDTDSPLCILANLPYLPPEDKRSMPKSVTSYEPSMALFASNKGLALNERLLAQASEHNAAFVLLEFDPPQAPKLRDIAARLFPNAIIRIHHDRCGRDRILEVLRTD
ncbi:peptide chain release factor N(5)-glutamine methyltransferase [Candidatus Uhrbacteria bacterium]|nr:MAG: peptide chain release factor N(5)-glutamine methyltransferase [Candidatus Uhrbacteria bacterium]